LVAQLTGNQGELRCLAFFPDGKRLVSGGSGEIRIWDIEAGQELLSLPVIDNRVAHIAVNPAGNAVLAISPSGRVQVWDADSVDSR
jgi:WD40 repeat protein